MLSTKAQKEGEPRSSGRARSQTAQITGTRSVASGITISGNSRKISKELKPEYTLEYRTKLEGDGIYEKMLQYPTRRKAIIDQ